ncbi:hypothetical protein VNO78_15286 [Psophocarpus tetragonolobus]|uniref:Uncharacterized protein n=1 Tax=Psophocarpus tetragonolobus TaxID=3891 RepID=A0AAN9SDV9_PSOTE
MTNTTTNHYIHKTVELWRPFWGGFRGAINGHEVVGGVGNWRWVKEGQEGNRDILDSWEVPKATFEDVSWKT